MYQIKQITKLFELTKLTIFFNSLKSSQQSALEIKLLFLYPLNSLNIIKYYVNKSK